MSYDVGFEFDEFCRLVSDMGFSGSDADDFIGFILHSVNEILRGEVDARSRSKV